MHAEIKLGDIVLDVVRKDIKNVHLSVHPPTGRVRVSAPTRMSLETIRVFAISKLAWIRQHQRKLEQQERETPREYLERESHYLWGRRYLLRVIEKAGVAASVEMKGRRIVLTVPPGTLSSRREALMQAWYRKQLRDALPPLLEKWQRLMGVQVDRFFIQRMKTKWGSCSASRRTIRLNPELAKKPPECLEYIVVHELTHFIERHHNDRFVATLDRFLPLWRSSRDTLNAAPLAHEEWAY